MSRKRIISIANADKKLPKTVLFWSRQDNLFHPIIAAAAVAKHFPNSLDASWAAYLPDHPENLWARERGFPETSAEFDAAIPTVQKIMAGCGLSPSTAKRRQLIQRRELGSVLVNIDLVVTFSVESHHDALEEIGIGDASEEYWPSIDLPRAAYDSARFAEACEALCNSLSLQVQERFAAIYSVFGEQSISAAPIEENVSVPTLDDGARREATALGIDATLDVLERLTARGATIRFKSPSKFRSEELQRLATEVRNHHVELRESVAELQAARAAVGTWPADHNNPPVSLPETDAEDVLIAVKTIGEQIGKSNPDVRAVFENTKMIRATMRWWAETAASISARSAVEVYFPQIWSLLHNLVSVSVDWMKGVLGL